MNLEVVPSPLDTFNEVVALANSLTTNLKPEAPSYAVPGFLIPRNHKMINVYYFYVAKFWGNLSY